MKKVILSILIIFICTTSLISSTKAKNNGKSDIIQNCLNNYYKFLSGEISSISNGNENSSISINDIFLLDENYNRFTFFDSNHNGVPELHLSSMREYLIIECISNELNIVYSGTGYETLLNNGALLYTRYGGTPEHISYAYTELSADNIMKQITFSEYNTNNEENEDDLYIFDDIEISKNEFDEKTKNYLNMKSDMILWSDYWTFLFDKNNDE